MIFEVFARGGCRAYLVGCPETGQAAVLDPRLDQVERYLSQTARHGLELRYVVETHTHADHISGARALRAASGAALAAHHHSPVRDLDVRLEDGETLRVGGLNLGVLHTPGHTADSICLSLEDRVFTGDTLLAGGAGRTDLPSGDPGALYDSLFTRLLRLPPQTRIYPAHDYKDHGPSTIGAEIAGNPRLQVADRAAFVSQMQGLDLPPPTQLATALRVNIAGGKPLEQLLADAARRMQSISAAALAEQQARRPGEVVVVDLRDREAFHAGHIPGAVHLPRGELELRVDAVLPRPRARLVVCCEDGRLALLGAATLCDLGYGRVSVLEGGLQAWRAAGNPWAADGRPPTPDPEA